MKNVFLIWTWGVWKQFLKQHLHHHPIFKLVWIANSREYIFDDNWIKENEINEIIKNWANWEPYKNLNEILKKAEIFVDCTAWKEALKNFHIEAVKNWKKVVTANKNPISLYDFEIFKELIGSWSYWAECTIMAWAWVVWFLDRAKKSWDEIKSVTWVFSWTLAYICDELDKWKKISAIIKEAYEKWYTEPNPWDDLNWLDVARKLVVLARLAWHEINLEDIEIQTLLPKEFWNYWIEEFFEKAKSEDEKFENLVKKAKEKWKVLKYIASFENKNWKLKLFVWLKEFDKKSSIWSLQWSLNFAEVISNFYPEESPWSIKAPWAWFEVTANSLRRDIIDFL